MSIKLPKKFKFTHLNLPYTMELQNDGYTYTCNNGDRDFPLETDWAQSFFDNGTWVITDNYDEPELVLPFTFTYAGVSYDVFDSGNGPERVGILCKDSGWNSDVYPAEALKRNIKSGTYIVTSVGTQEPLESSTSGDNSFKPLTIQVDNKEALEAVKELTEALEHLEDVYKRVSKLFKDSDE